MERLLFIGALENFLKRQYSQLEMYGLRKLFFRQLAGAQSTEKNGSSLGY